MPPMAPGEVLLSPPIPPPISISRRRGQLARGIPCREEMISASGSYSIVPFLLFAGRASCPLPKVPMANSSSLPDTGLYLPVTVRLAAVSLRTRRKVRWCPPQPAEGGGRARAKAQNAVSSCTASLFFFAEGPQWG